MFTIMFMIPFVKQYNKQYYQSFYCHDALGLPGNYYISKMPYLEIPS
jgi:hypothetical protein